MVTMVLHTEQETAVVEGKKQGCEVRHSERNCSQESTAMAIACKIAKGIRTNTGYITIGSFKMDIII
jgi:hypothetical protein